MQALVWAGVAMTLAGLAGIVWCILAVRRARGAGLDEAALRAVLQRVVAVNLGAFGLSALGLGAVAAGLILG
ncbi:MAG: hypothetical protein ACK4S2_13545 [Gemmobacter sp.]|uniref:hypothetical protein n=1 Tax=Gemmobacter sp. TaxID=1898957 RepID=UPI00391BB778